MIEPLLHPESKALVAKLQAQLPQSLLISGERGVGLFTIASFIAKGSIARIIVPQDKAEKDDPENGTISASAIRKLYEQTKSKQTKAHVVIIDNAERMSKAAANAFLKLLEEPPENIHFILTSHHPDQLLPTIRSRVQRITIRPVTEEQTNALLTQLKVSDATRRRQLEFIAPGLPAELNRLIVDEAYFKKRAEIMGDARAFLSAKEYEKIVIIQKYQLSRPAALQLLDSALLIARRSFGAKPQPALVTQLNALLDAYQTIEANGNVRLQLARIML